MTESKKLLAWALLTALVLLFAGVLPAAADDGAPSPPDAAQPAGDPPAGPAGPPPAEPAATNPEGAPAAGGEAAPQGTYTIRAVNIKFEGSNEYTLSKRGSTIYDPIWQCNVGGSVIRNDPACFRNNTPFTVRVDIAGTPSVPGGGLQVQVQCFGYESYSGWVMIPASKKTITVTNWSNADYTTLYWTSNNLPAYVTAYSITLSFEIWVYLGGSWVWQNQHVTGVHTCYTTMNAPLAPMGQPWTEVIDRATRWSAGLSSEASISDELVRDLYNASWTYDGTQTHSYWSGSYTSQTLKLGEMLDSTWADCKDFGNFYTCLMRSVGFGGQAYFLLGPFYTKPILGSHDTVWRTMGWNHHQFGWHSSLVHDASLKLDQAAPKYAINMDRDTTYKSYLYQSGTWSPQGSLVCAVQ